MSAEWTDAQSQTIINTPDVVIRIAVCIKTCQQNVAIFTTITSLVYVQCHCKFDQSIANSWSILCNVILHCVCSNVLHTKSVLLKILKIHLKYI